MRKDSKIAIGIAAAIVVVVIIGFVGISMLPSTVTNKEYSITYELNGGDNAAENPTSYKYGTGTELYNAHKTGYIFTGWYSDSGLTDPMTNIPSSYIGNITLYAGWQNSLVGTKLTYSVDGTIKETALFSTTTTTVKGSYSNSYLMYSEARGYYYENTIDITRTTGQSSVPVKNTSTIWSNDDSDDVEWSKIGTGTITLTGFGDIDCYIYKGTTDEFTETQYIGINDSIMYECVHTSESKSIVGSSVTKITFYLEKKTSVEKTGTVTMKAYSDIGITATGSITCEKGSQITLTASATSDKTFKGWYDENNNLLSKSKTYIIDSLLIDYKIYALNDTYPDFIYDDKSIKVTPAVTLQSGTVVWTFTDGGETKNITADTLDYTFSETGEYRIDYEGKTSDGSNYYGTFQSINGAVKKSFKWTYNNTEYTYDLYISYKDYKAYADDDISRSQGSEAHDLEFVTYNDKYVQQLAKALEDKAASMSEVEKANFILSFVQNIEYKSDTDTKGVEEYWKYPVETLYEQNGDCEDTAILYCAIMKALHYDTALLLFSGHMASGLSVDGATGEYFEKDGVKYFYCETTSTGWKVGQAPSDYNEGRVIKVV